MSKIYLFNEATSDEQTDYQMNNKIIILNHAVKFSKNILTKFIYM